MIHSLIVAFLSALAYGLAALGISILMCDPCPPRVAVPRVARHDERRSQ